MATASARDLSSAPAVLPSDIELMRRAGAGEVDAFAEIYDRHASALLALVQRMLLHTGEAQDLLHDVFLEAWQSAREYDPERGSVRTWLLVRTRSRALDRMGRRAREHNARSAMPVVNPVSAAHTSTTVADLRVAVRQALDGLDSNVRMTLELTYFGGLTAAEIAAHMQVPAGTVKSRMARGLSQLEVVLRELSATGTIDDR